MSDTLFERLAAADPQRGLHLFEDFGHRGSFLAYRAMPERIAACAEHFRAQGIQPGDRILFPFETSEAVILSFFGLMALGAVPFSVKPYILSTPKGAYRDFLSRLSSRHGVNRILDVPSVRSLELALVRVPLPPAGARLAGARPRVPEEDALAFVQFSSGSTAFPKGVPITWRNLHANLRMIQNQGALCAQDRCVSWLPLYHDMGLVGGMLACMYGHCDSLLTQPMSFLMDPMGWLEFLSEHRGTLAVIPNFAIDYTLKILNGLGAEELRELDLSALRTVYLGSEPINIANLERFTVLLAPQGLRREAIKPCYGMAEVVLMVSCVGEEGWRVVTGPHGQPAISVGYPLSEFEVRLRTEEGRVSGERELGQIELRSGSLAQAYYADERPLRGEEGFYPTGDLGFMQDGELFITGRLNDRIKINGQSYFSSDFEQAVERLAFIRSGRSAVIQAQGRVVVLAEVNGPEVLEDRSVGQRQVAAAILEAMGVTVALEDVLFIRYGQLPKTSSGKLQRRAITEAYEQGHIRVATSRDLRVDLLKHRARRLVLGSVLGARQRGERWLQSWVAWLRQGKDRLVAGVWPRPPS
ncbi:AMP-binding protein [Stigmatella aurantiaca]|uniref:Saframycin Mx1 synthetase B n=1 Tax=Stigmatella aurantiaca (strain DW4/3-1) TaxID=378806 RepID=Q08ST3_STIAD|nr:AMP-binding protein [Stigmatella aurantiaca]ADO72915.1 Saframycin Mx1 synthetase B [Stigmatella aurantiaca DW4/3-1]EAU63537.1 saframycin Mx1 synthetase B [Stigmatella aurantiaca DW4/3-1]